MAPSIILTEYVFIAGFERVVGVRGALFLIQVRLARNPCAPFATNMVVITRENFLQTLPELDRQLQSALFVSFDEEMTGIEMPAYRNSRADSVEERYLKMIQVATRFSIIQFGLCIFHFEVNLETNVTRIVGTPYTFFLFPEYGPDIILNASSCAFLRKNNMDFGQWIG